MDKATKEKILEMACLCDRCLEKSHADDGCWNCENRGTYHGALKMAEWMKQRMIEKAAEWMDNELYLFYSGSEHWVASHKKVNVKEFIDNFKKNMEEQI